MDVDHRLAVVTEYMQGWIREHFTEPFPEPAALSAKDIFHGKGIFRDNAKWSLAKRIEMLEDILRAPRALGIPAVMGYCRNNLPANPEPKGPREWQALNHGRAFMMRALAAEDFLRQETSPRKLATMILENNNETRSVVKSQQRGMRTPAALEAFSPDAHRLLPLRRIIEDPLFTEKGSTAPLVVADACAFTFSRWLSGRSHAENLMTALLDTYRPPQSIFSDPAGFQFYRLNRGLSQENLAALAKGLRF